MGIRVQKQPRLEVETAAECLQWRPSRSVRRMFARGTCCPAADGEFMIGSDFSTDMPMMRQPPHLPAAANFVDANKFASAKQQIATANEQKASLVSCRVNTTAVQTGPVSCVRCCTLHAAQPHGMVSNRAQRLLTGKNAIPILARLQPPHAWPAAGHPELTLPRAISAATHSA